MSSAGRQDRPLPLLAGLGLDAVRDVGPGGHYFGTAHTLERFETAFYSPIVSDWRNFETWEQAGSPTAMQKANAVWQKELAAYERPPMDAAMAGLVASTDEASFKAAFPALATSCKNCHQVYRGEN